MVVQHRFRAIDLFAGGGGASEGIRLALGVAPEIAINHDPHAIAMHRINHPGTIHLEASVYDVEPEKAAAGRHVDLLWASPDCTHFSRAKGGKPRKKEIRALAWVVVTWAQRVRPSVICVENVAEFLHWGPLNEHNRVIRKRRGETFKAWVSALEELGYQVEWRVLNAADYGTPTSRKRVFIVARCDGLPIRWPEPTHGPDPELLPYRTAAECIDWSIPCPSIFERKRPLAEATQRRIAGGIRRYVLEAPRPFLLNLTHGGRLEPIDEPARTITAAHRGEKALVAPTLIQTGYGERKGQRPRALDIEAPLGTVVAGGSKHALVAAFLAKHYTGVYGQDLRQPTGTVTAKDHHALVAAFLIKYYGTGGQWQTLDEPLHTIVGKARFGLVTVDIGGEQYALVDIGMRMLQPRELARAQGFSDDYVLTGTKTQQIAKIGNSVCPPVARALVESQFHGSPREGQLPLLGAA